MNEAEGMSVAPEGHAGLEVHIGSARVNSWGDVRIAGDVAVKEGATLDFSVEFDGEVLAVLGKALLSALVMEDIADAVAHRLASSLRRQEP